MFSLCRNVVMVVNIEDQIKEDSTPLHRLNYHHQYPHHHRHHGQHPILIVIITFLQDIEDQIRGDSTPLDKRHRQAYLKLALPPQQNQKFKKLCLSGNK